MPSLLRTKGLTRKFGKRTAVRDLNLEVAEGDVYGFVGLNGAGKTTTIRLILQLIRPSAGSVYAFDRDIPEHFRWVMKQVGALVEAPAFYPALSARQNIEVLARLSGRVDRKHIGEILERVGLGLRADERVRSFSQGMRQRLGIAMALFGHPKLVILDEPTNGLDPQGMRDVRALITEMNRGGTTFFISSHLLHEVEQMCNRVGVLQDGELKAQAETSALLNRTTHSVRIVAKPADKALEALRAMEEVEQADPKPDGSILARLRERDFGSVNAALVGSEVSVEEFTPSRMTLEEFLVSG